MRFNQIGQFGILDSDLNGEDDVRQSGRTLGMAYKTIGHALTTPGRAVAIIDHDPTHKANRYLFELIQDIVGQHGILCVEFNKQNLTMTYNPFKDVKAPEYIYTKDGWLRQVAPEDIMTIDGKVYTKT